MEPKQSDEELNKILYEKVVGECWHEGNAFKYPNDSPIDRECHKCNLPRPFFNPDYLHDPVAYWKLLQKVKLHEKWCEFIASFKFNPRLDARKIISTLLDQQRGCEAIADFFVPEWRD